MSKILFQALLLILGTIGLMSCVGTANGIEEVSMSQTENMAGEVSETEIQTSPDTNVQKIDYSAMFSGINTAEYSLTALTKMDPNLSTFAVLMQQADLSDALEQEGSYTLFAPSNQAFADWPDDSVNTLMMPEHRAQLIRLLQAHVLSGTRSVSNLSSSPSIESSGGEHLAVFKDDVSVTVGEATLVRSDVQAFNGVLHVVDKVLTTAEDIIMD